MSGARFTLFDARSRPPAPPPAVEPASPGLDRRQALALLSAAMASALAACGKPDEEILPYTEQPEGLVPGVPQRYATALTLGGYARGAMAIAVDGRPIKIEGSPSHPYSLGATDVFAEAEVLSLYDPTRAVAPSNADGPASWEALQSALQPRLAAARRGGGAGLTVLTQRIVSPTELRLMAALQAAYPHMQWRRFEPVNDDNARAGARLAFGRPLTLLPRLAEAQVVLSLDADPLGPGPEQIANGRSFVAGRKPDGGGFSRWYVAEPGWSLTGANADHRLALHPAEISALAMAVAQALGGAVGKPVALPAPAARFAAACAADLKAHAGHALVLVGQRQPAEIHALGHWINAALRAPLNAITPLDLHPDDHMHSLRGLADDLHAGRVETLIVLGGNPAYHTPGDLAFVRAIRRAPFSLHLTAYENETSALCTWRAPLSHALESWGDARAPDGTASIVQPLIRPLHDTRTQAQVLAMLSGAIAPSAYDLVRQTWDDRMGASRMAHGQPPAAPSAGDEADTDVAPAPANQPGINRPGTAEPAPAPSAVADLAWKQALSDGVIAGSASAATPLAPAAFPALAPGAAPRGWTLVLGPDPTLFDGRYAENAWLQECPKPLTSEVWGSSLAISPADAKALGLKDLDHVRLSSGGRSVEASVRVSPGHADTVISGFIGGGRAQAGPIGTGVGCDFAPLMTAASPWTQPVQVERVHGHKGPPAFQAQYRLEGDAKRLSPVLALPDLPGLKAHPLDATQPPPSLLPPNPAHDPHHEPAWAMVIDQAACIGCNACVVSCQAENNVPVVGPEEIARGRDMHWLRIDVYDTGEANEHRPAFQPVPCMHCEHAPCEPVCPVEASVHDHEGLNVQVYNRCIGTRFCESNCPYKVRRFNWYGYAHDQAYANMGDDAYDAQKNPDVTVRARGVMEKCTYCVQRISGARRAAEAADRPIGAHEVVTACQSACPTNAISFGDKANAASGISARRDDPRHFALLAEEGTRPRTTYLARVRNANPVLGTAS